MKATVIKSTGNTCFIRFEDGDIQSCRVPGRFRLKGLTTTNPVAVGDFVEVSKNARGEWRVEQIYDRKNYLVRKSVNLSHQKHVIAANIDQAVLVVTLEQPETSTGFMDRFLVSCEAYDIPAVIVFNKWDVYSNAAKDEFFYRKTVYESAGYKVLATSAETGYQLSEVKRALEGKTTLLGGHSGVGKSSLVNAIQPDLDLKVGDISIVHRKGQHTTTFAQMVYVKNINGYLIDSPGIKGFGLVDMQPEEIGDYFPEFFAYKDQCRFHNCTHRNEPGCAVKLALEHGDLPHSRYQSYLSMMQGDEAPYR
ncbi:MAG: ribosome small subunit-dependent GTPase A [Cryomorphaceae bacterium]|nr:ribosome small subunit-dependent GTPase A [Cryomorphaceae bacterium]